MNFRAPHHTEAHGMNLVPLIDVLLILLIFFIVTFSMSQREKDLNISVPAAAKTVRHARPFTTDVERSRLLLMKRTPRLQRSAD